MVRNEKCPYMCNEPKSKKEIPCVVSDKTHPGRNPALQTQSEKPLLANSDTERERKLKPARKRKSKKTSSNKSIPKYGSSSSTTTSVSKPSCVTAGIRNNCSTERPTNTRADSEIKGPDSEIKSSRRGIKKSSKHRSGSEKSLRSSETSDSITRKSKKKEKGHKTKPQEKNKPEKQRKKSCSCCGKVRSRLACCCIRCCLACCCIAQEKRGKLVACSTSCQTPSCFDITKSEKRSRRKHRRHKRKLRYASSGTESSSDPSHSEDEWKNTTSEKKKRNFSSESGSKTYSKHPGKYRRSRRKRKNGDSSRECDKKGDRKHSWGRYKRSSRTREHTTSSSGSELRRSRSRHAGETPKEVAGDYLPKKVHITQGRCSGSCKGCPLKQEDYDKEGGDEEESRYRSCCRCRPPTSGTETDAQKPSRRSRPRTRGRSRPRTPHRGHRPPAGLSRAPTSRERPADQPNSKRDAPSDRAASGQSTPRRRRRRSHYRNPSKDRANVSCPKCKKNQPRIGRESTLSPDDSSRMPLTDRSSADLRAMIQSLLPPINCPGCPLKQI